jgi:hypothetical protein
MICLDTANKAEDKLLEWAEYPSSRAEQNSKMSLRPDLGKTKTALDDE